MLFHVLGPLELHGPEGQPIAITAAKQQRLLTMLLLRRNTWVTVDSLVEAVWSDRAPVSATGNIKTYVHHLRQVLPAPPSGQPRIDSRPGYYRLRVERDECDVIAFVDLVDRGCAAVTPAEAIEYHRRALALWRGDPFDLLDSDIAAPEVARLREVRWAARDALADALLATGQPAEAIALLAPLTSEEPLREPTWQRLLMAYHRAGRRADGLLAYQRARNLLVAELGVEPGAELQRIHRLLLDDSAGDATETSDTEAGATEATTVAASPSVDAPASDAAGEENPSKSPPRHDATADRQSASGERPETSPPAHEGSSDEAAPAAHPQEPVGKDVSPSPGDATPREQVKKPEQAASPAGPPPVVPPPRRPWQTPAPHAGPVATPPRRGLAARVAAVLPKPLDLDLPMRPRDWLARHVRVSAITALVLMLVVVGVTLFGLPPRAPESKQSALAPVPSASATPSASPSLTQPGSITGSASRNPTTGNPADPVRDQPTRSTRPPRQNAPKPQAPPAGPPQLQILSPSWGAVVSGWITIRVQVSNPSLLEQVDFHYLTKRCDDPDEWYKKYIGADKTPTANGIYEMTFDTRRANNGCLHFGVVGIGEGRVYYPPEGKYVEVVVRN